MNPSLPSLHFITKRTKTTVQIVPDPDYSTPEYPDTASLLAMFDTPSDNATITIDPSSPHEAIRDIYLQLRNHLNITYNALWLHRAIDDFHKALPDTPIEVQFSPNHEVIRLIDPDTLQLQIVLMSMKA